MATPPSQIKLIVRRNSVDGVFLTPRRFAPKTLFMPSTSWILTEPYAGLQAQALGLAEAAGFSPTVVDLNPKPPLGLLAPSLWPAPLRTVGLKERPSGILFTAGGTGAAVGAALRRAGTRVVQVQHPRMSLKKFDVVVANVHDEITGPNVIVTRTALHRARPEVLEAARQKWTPRFSHLPRPLMAVLVGGSNGRFKLDEAQGLQLARNLAGVMARDRVGIVLTTSRRTAPDVHESLRGVLAPLGAYIWDGLLENPYYGMLACADVIVVTVDSISMVSEAIATRAPVLLADLPGKSRRNTLFLKQFLDDGRVRPFAGRMDWWPVSPIDDTQEAAAQVRQRLGL
jgi:mitochondrial fission protein ELM1